MNCNMNGVVTIEMAKLAKIAGFDERCHYRWTDVPVKGLIGKSCFSNNSMYSKAKIERFVAPTYAQLIEWLAKQRVFFNIIPFVGEDEYRYVYGFGYMITVVNLENKAVLTEELYQPNMDEYGFENRLQILYKGIERALKILININLQKV